MGSSGYGPWYSNSDPTPWIQERVTAGQDTPSRLAIGATGAAHLTYVRLDSGAETGTWYASNASSGSWQHRWLTREDKGAGVDVDSTGAAHVAFRDRLDLSRPETAGIYYATNASGAWVTERLTADTAFEDVQCISLVVDSEDKVHIVYGIRAGNVLHRSNPDGTWVRRVIPGIDECPRLDLDPAGVLHVLGVHYLTPHYSLRYLTSADDGATWSTQKLATSGFFHSFDVAADGAGDAHIAFTADELIQYLTNETEAWLATTFRNPQTVLLHPIAAAGDGEVVLGQPFGSGILLRRRAEPNWSATRLSTGHIAGSSALRLTDTGEAHVLYSDGNGLIYTHHE